VPEGYVAVYVVEAQLQHADHIKAVIGRNVQVFQAFKEYVKV
jgi:hypothetical protein